MMTNKPIPFLLCLLLLATGIRAQESGSSRQQQVPGREIVRDHVQPVRILWQAGAISNAEQLLRPGNSQSDLTNAHVCILKNGKTDTTSLLLDFGRELHGGVEIVTGKWRRGRPQLNIRVRFGESANEAMAELREKGATNDHAIRDFQLPVPWLGRLQIGETGFRFVRIDFTDPNAELHLKEVRALATYRDIPYLGSFNCSDERLNRIWQTGAYTVHLNMQDYLWDGIKRDRLVWAGDLHPEVATVNAVFGHNEVVTKSLDLARDVTPLPGWMSGISTYSMWWIIIHHDWYLHHGDLAYLKEQQPYLSGLVRQIAARIGPDGKEVMDGSRFLDWSSQGDTSAIHAGLQAMASWSLSTAAQLAKIIGDEETYRIATTGAEQLRRYTPSMGSSKQAAALMVLADLLPAGDANRQLLSVGGAAGFSTFYGYYILQAMARAGDYQSALDVIRSYWGGMLDLGATTFWEHFDLSWLTNAGRIDELVPEGKKDVHGDYGDHCYVGYRHSLCHGWASGPTAWLTAHVLGIRVTEAGCKTITIQPNLADLDFAEGSFPTPHGVLHVRHVRQPDGRIRSTIKAPKGVRIIRR